MPRGNVHRHVGSALLRTLVQLGVAGLGLLAAAVPWAHADAVPYPAPAGVPRAAEYTVTAAGRPVFVEKFKDVAYGAFALHGTAEVVVTFEQPVAPDTVRLLPASKAPSMKVEGRNVRFTVTKPSQLVLEAPGQPRLFLFADAPETDAPSPGTPGVVDAVTAGADPTGRSLSTDTLQRALDELGSRPSGGTLLVPKGVYRIGTLVIRGRTRMHLAPGARLQGTSDPADYPLDPGAIEKGTNGLTMTFSRSILIDGADGASITGRGTIVGGGSALRKAGRAANLIRVRSSRNVRISGVTLLDPAAWNLHVLDCDNVVIDDIRIINDQRVPNTDGIDPDASRHVRIERVFAYCGDDNIAIKSSGNSGLLGDVEDILIRDCTFITLKSSLKVGTETRAARMHNIRFEYIDVIEADRALALYCRDGAAFSAITFSDIRVGRIGLDRRASTQKQLMQFEVTKRAGRGSISDVRISRLQLAAPAPKASQFRGLDETHPVRGVVLSDVSVAGRKLSRIEDFALETNAFVYGIRVEDGH